MSKVRVTIWNEYRHEVLEERIAKVYPKGIHGAIAEMLGVSKRTLYYKKYLLPNFGETASGKMEWTRKEVEDWLKTDKNVLKEQYLARAKENAM